MRSAASAGVLALSVAVIGLAVACSNEPVAPDAGSDASDEAAKEAAVDAAPDAPADARSDADAGDASAGSFWERAGVFVVSPSSTFPAGAYGTTLADNHFAWVALQILDGTTPLDETSWTAWSAAWHAAGAKVGAWGVNRANPTVEADAVAAKLTAYGFDFYIADAEEEYKYTQSPCNATCPCSGACSNNQCWSAACFGRSQAFVAEFRKKMGASYPAAMSSFGRVDRADIDWGAWKAGGFVFLPQAYWNMDAIYQPSLCVTAATTAKLCEAGTAPCWALGDVHPTIGLWQSLPTPSASGYVPDLATAKSTGFSVFRANGVASADWAVLGDGITQKGIAAP